MLHVDQSRRPVEQAKYGVVVARSDEEVREAQRLRWQVFVEEQGSRPAPGIHGIEADHFDAHCHHLIVRDLETGEAVGTYRVLMPDKAARLGGFYTEQEFDLRGLAQHRAQIVEIGRSCVHADYRSGIVISLLWAGLAGLIMGSGAQFIIGCASISMQDDGKEAAEIYTRLATEHLAQPEYQVRPLDPLDLGIADQPSLHEVKPPPLIKGYIRAGAKIAGPPAVDRDFGTADLPMILPLESLSPRYARYFVGR